jgi:hypothetical protein
MGDPEGSQEKEIRAADQMTHLHMRERRKEDTHAPIHRVSTVKSYSVLDWDKLRQSATRYGVLYCVSFPCTPLASRVSFETRFDSKQTSFCTI